LPFIATSSRSHIGTKLKSLVSFAAAGLKEAELTIPSKIVFRRYYLKPLKHEEQEQRGLETTAQGVQKETHGEK
jgi:hypothetical protein